MSNKEKKQHRVGRYLAFAAAAVAILHPTARRVPWLFLKWWIELLKGCKPREGWQEREFLVIAHRGAPTKHPENTMPSIRAAIEEDRANALEIDICLTSDDQLVVWHDWDPCEPKAYARELTLEPDVRFAPFSPNSGSTHCRPINEISLADLRAHYGYREKHGSDTPVAVEIPTLEEVLQYLTTRPSLKYVFLDIKIPEEESQIVPHMMGLLYALLERFKPKFTVVYLTEFVGVMEAMERHAPHRYYSLDVEPPPGFILDPCGFTSSEAAIKFENAFASTIHPKISTFAPWTIFRRVIECDIKRRDAHNRKNPRVPIEKVIGCTINAAEEMRCLIQLGIDGLITDRPDLLREVATRLGRPLA